MGQVLNLISVTRLTVRFVVKPFVVNNCTDNLHAI